MQEKMLSITDENTILVTARFYVENYYTKTEDEVNQYIDFDLIVKNDVTCNQFLDAIRIGLEKKLVNSFQIDLNKVKIEYEHVIQNKTQFKYTDKDIYLLCWGIFQKCYSFYTQIDLLDSQLENDIDHLHGEVKNIVARGYINFQYDKEEDILSVAHENQLWLSEKNHGEKSLKDLGFMTSSVIIFDGIGEHSSSALLDKSTLSKVYQKDFPHYIISNRPLYKFDDTPISIIPPTEPPKQSKRKLWKVLFPALLIAGVMLLSRLFIGGSNNFLMIFMYGFMSLVTVFTTWSNYTDQKKEYEESLKEWREQYENYISHLIKKIKDKQNWDIQQLHKIYPPKINMSSSQKNYQLGLIEMAEMVHSDIFSRSIDHPDFLSIRLGISSKNSQLVPSIFKIKGEKREVVFTSTKYKNLDDKSNNPFAIVLDKEDTKNNSEGYLIDLPFEIAKKYAYLSYAPILLNLKECGTLGVVLEDERQFNILLDNILLDLCFYQSPNDLQCIYFCKESKYWLEKQNIIQKYTHLPHFRELLGDMSQFAFNKQDANLILNRLLEILSQRKNSKENSQSPHIVFIIHDEYELKRHLVSEYLPQSSNDKSFEQLGITFIFYKKYEETLPRYCGKIIKYYDNKWYLLPHTQYLSKPEKNYLNNSKTDYQFEFIPDKVPEYDSRSVKNKEYERFFKAYKILSALYYDRIAQGNDIPSHVELFQLYHSDLEGNNSKAFKKLYKNFIVERWKVNLDITESLRVPIGMNENGLVYLDLHEKGDGPHMLVAGTTGSGKTESILTYLISLCTYYSPEQVNLLLMDMKGAGFVGRIGKLPHVVGTVTDISGDESGTGMSYMLNRFLRSMNAEVKYRKLMFDKMGVDSIDKYIKAHQNIEEHIDNLKNNGQHHYSDKQLNEMRKLPLLSHLFLVIDEFGELMSISSDNPDLDFKKAINTLARVGRSLGFHIILISQNIEEAITPEVSTNSRARLCLKVASPQASKQMLGTDVAASPTMPGNGRAYLLVGTGSRFEYFQSGYSGAYVNKQEERMNITHATMGGYYEWFFDSVKDKSKIVLTKETQLQFMVNQMIELNQYKIRQVFQQPLSHKYYYEFNYVNKQGHHVDLTEEEGDE